MPNNTFNPINDALNIKQRPEQHVPHTEFNRSYPFIGTGSMGQIIPFFFDETMPGDFWRISGEYLFRFAPLYLPILTQVKVYADYYYIPKRLLWGIPKKDAVDELADYVGWESFISGFDDNVLEPTIDVPLGNYAGAATDELISFFGIPTNTENIVTPGVLQIIPFPFIALLQIWDQYYRNDQVQDKRGFVYQNPVGQSYEYLADKFVQFGQLPQDPEKPIIRRLRRNWDNDYFTVMTPTPQLGANVLIPMINDLSDFWQMPLGVAVPTTSYPSRWRNLIAPPNVAEAGDIYINASAPGITATDGGGGAYIGLDIQETAATIAQLRKNLQLTEILERAMRTGDKYDDFVFKFFEEDIDPLDLNIPQWFGGHVGRVVVSDVFATANTGGETLPANTVGSFAGNAVSVDKIKQHKIKCREHGYIIGLLSVVPESAYQNGLHPLWTREKWYDYPFEQFALIGDRPLKRMEMQLILSSTVEPEFINTYMENEAVLGYVPMYHEMRYRNAVTAGQMRSLWPSYHLGRIFGQDQGDGIDLGDELLLCIPRITDVFQVTWGTNYREDEVHILVHNMATVDRRLPKYAVPQSGL